MPPPYSLHQPFSGHQIKPSDQKPELFKAAPCQNYLQVPKNLEKYLVDLDPIDESQELINSERSSFLSSHTLHPQRLSSGALGSLHAADAESTCDSADEEAGSLGCAAGFGAGAIGEE